MILEFSHAIACMVSHTCSAKDDFPLLKLKQSFDVLSSLCQTDVQTDPDSLSQSRLIEHSLKSLPVTIAMAKMLPRSVAY